MVDMRSEGRGTPSVLLVIFFTLLVSQREMSALKFVASWNTAAPSHSHNRMTETVCCTCMGHGQDEERGWETASVQPCPPGGSPPMEVTWLVSQQPIRGVYACPIPLSDSRQSAVLTTLLLGPLLVITNSGVLQTAGHMCGGNSAYCVCIRGL